MNRGSRIRFFLKNIQKLIFILCFAFILKLIFDYKENIVQIINQANWIYIIFSLLFWQLLVGLIPYFSYQVILAQGHKLDYFFVFQSFVNRLPAKYLPGGVWQTVARFHDLNKAGVRKKELSILIFYENVWSTLIAGILGGLGVVFYHSESFWGAAGIVILSGSILCFLVVFLLRRQKYILTFRAYMVMTLINGVFWVLASLSFWFYIKSLMIFSSDTEFVLNSVNYIFSWLIGFFSIFTPQGIGVFELTMSQLSKLNYTLEETIVLLASFRLIVFVSDLISWVSLVLWKKYQHD